LGSRILVVSAMLALLLVGVEGAGAAATLTDPQGDAVGGAGDITQVVVSNEFDGKITFAVTIADRATFTSDDFLIIVLNTDKDTTTGIGGADYAIVLDSTGGALLRASGTTFAPAPQTTLTLADNGKTVAINRSDLGDTAGFSYFVTSGLASNSSASDDAPDSGVATYDLELKPVLSTLAARFTPAKPKAGKAFRLSSTTLRLDDRTAVKADSITCVAKLNGRRVAGRCAWRIPRNGKGKRLVVTLTAHYKGASATFTPWRFRVG
jgi:hypothetical protein